MNARAIAATVLLVGSVAPARASAPCDSPLALGCETWTTTYAGASVDKPVDLATSPDGTSLYVAGESARRGITVAYDAATGSQRWEAKDGTTDSPIELQAAVVVSPDGERVYVAMERFAGSASASDVATLAYDAATGALLWERLYAGAGATIDRPADIAISPDGARVVVSATTATPSTKTDMLTLVLDADTGAPVMTARFDGPAHDYDAPAAVVAGRSQIVVAGRAIYQPPYGDYVAVAYGYADPEPVWVASYDGAARAADLVAAVAMDATESTVYVTGQSAIGPMTQFGVAPDFATLALDASTGARCWLATYDGPAGAQDVATDLAVSPDGARVYVTGFGYGTGPRSSHDVVTLAYDAATGARQWESRYDSLPGVDDRPVGVVVAPGGDDVYVGGHSLVTAMHGDLQTLRIDAASGALEWIARHKGQTADIAAGVALGGNRVFVTAQNWISGARAPDIVTVCYEV